jgi:hypothetical protein
MTWLARVATGKSAKFSRASPLAKATLHECDGGSCRVLQEPPYLSIIHKRCDALENKGEANGG